jgi:hypothetical protein
MEMWQAMAARAHRHRFQAPLRPQCRLRLAPQPRSLSAKATFRRRSALLARGCRWAAGVRWCAIGSLAR